MTHRIFPILSALAASLTLLHCVKVDRQSQRVLKSEEYFLYDPTGATATNGFIPSYKATYVYDHNKLVQIDLHDYNYNTNSYDPAYKYEEYHYDGKGRLAQRINFVGSDGFKYVRDYEYSGNETVKITRQEYFNSKPINQPDWLSMEKKHSSINVKYYQLSDQLYAELNYELDEKGNVLSAAGSPDFPVRKIYYKHDNSPNPYKLPESGGEYGENANKYFSENNMLEATSDSNMKSTWMIEYNEDGYPATITLARSSRRILTYQ